MKRPIIPPTASTKENVSGNRQEELKHPAYGQIGCFIMTGQNTLYGSDFEVNSSIRVEIRESVLMRDLSHDWTSAGKLITAVELTHSEWARFISTPNTGEGVQCTLRTVRAGPMEEPPGLPLRDTGLPLHSREVDEALAATGKHLADLVASIETMPNLTKRQREDLLANARAAERKVSDTVPFIARSMEEHLVARVARAKLEIVSAGKTLLAKLGAFQEKRQLDDIDSREDRE